MITCLCKCELYRVLKLHVVYIANLFWHFTLVIPNIFFICLSKQSCVLMIKCIGISVDIGNIGIALLGLIPIFVVRPPPTPQMMLEE